MQSHHSHAMLLLLYLSRTQSLPLACLAQHFPRDLAINLPRTVAHYAVHVYLVIDAVRQPITSCYHLSSAAHPGRVSTTLPWIQFNGGYRLQVTRADPSRIRFNVSLLYRIWWLVFLMGSSLHHG